MLMIEETDEDINEFIQAWGYPDVKSNDFYQWLNVECERFSNLLVMDLGETRLVWAI